jgi:hypothetical protein
MKKIRWISIGEWSVPCDYEKEVGTAEVTKGSIKVWDETNLVIFDLKHPVSKERMSVIISKDILKGIAKKIGILKGGKG